MTLTNLSFHGLRPVSFTLSLLLDLTRGRAALCINRWHNRHSEHYLFFILLNALDEQAFLLNLALLLRKHESVTRQTNRPLL